MSIVANSKNGKIGLHCKNPKTAAAMNFSINKYLFWHFADAVFVFFPFRPILQLILSTNYFFVVVFFAGAFFAGAFLVAGAAGLGAAFLAGAFSDLVGAFFAVAFLAAGLESAGT